MDLTLLVIQKAISCNVTDHLLVRVGPPGEGATAGRAVADLRLCLACGTNHVAGAALKDLGVALKIFHADL